MNASSELDLIVDTIKLQRLIPVWTTSNFKGAGKLELVQPFCRKWYDTAKTFLIVDYIRPKGVEYVQWNLVSVVNIISNFPDHLFSFLLFPCSIELLSLSLQCLLLRKFVVLGFKEG